MWMDCDCKGTRKLINSDSVQSFDIMSNSKYSDHDYRLEIQYTNVINITSECGDPMGGSTVEVDHIFQGTYEECKKFYDAVIDRICEVDTMKPIVKLVEPDVYQAKPKHDTPSPEGANDDSVTEESEKPNLDKRVVLYVRKSNLPPQPGSVDMRSKKGGLGILTSVITEMSNVRDGRIKLTPDHWYNEPGDVCYTISTNMTKNPQLKEYYTNKGFVTLED